MLWLEMARYETHGAGTWGFGQSLWSPSRKQGSITKWPFWETLLEVKEGDSVLHLRGVGQKAAFVGFSTAQRDGFETFSRPPDPGQWGYATTFYRVLLKEYTHLPTPIPLRKLFSDQDSSLRKYFQQNKSKPSGQKKRIFFVIQSGRIQCLNGAYLSEVDDELGDILLGSDYSSGTPVSRPKVIDVRTGERIQELKSRMGQKTFSDNVRNNYSHRCCFPECPIADDEFLVASHIARWVDVPELRGSLDNGLCLCLMHDRAFEMGLFTIATDLTIVTNKEGGTFRHSSWCQAHLLPHEGKVIRQGAVLPSEEALRHHWERTGINT